MSDDVVCLEMQNSRK